MNKFDSSTLTPGQKQLLEAFMHRRKKLDEYITKMNIARVTCPGCGYPTMSEKGGYEICEICAWEDDGQDDARADEVWGGPNGHLSLTENRLNFCTQLAQYAKDLGATIKDDPAEIIKAMGSSAPPFLFEQLITNYSSNR